MAPTPIQRRACPGLWPTHTWQPVGEQQRVAPRRELVPAGLPLAHVRARREGEVRGSDLPHLLAGRRVPEAYLQEYLAHEKTPPPRTLQEAYA